MSKELMHLCVDMMWTAVQREEWRGPMTGELEKLLVKLRDEAETHRELEAACRAAGPDYQTFPAYHALTQRWGLTISIPKLQALAFCIANVKGLVAPSRSERRKRSLLFCWFHRNWDVAAPVLQGMDLEESV
jgi:hypothetical protein